MWVVEVIIDTNWSRDNIVYDIDILEWSDLWCACRDDGPREHNRCWHIQRVSGKGSKIGFLNRHSNIDVTVKYEGISKATKGLLSIRHGMNKFICNRSVHDNVTNHDIHITTKIKIISIRNDGDTGAKNMYRYIHTIKGIVYQYTYNKIWTSNPTYKKPQTRLNTHKHLFSCLISYMNDAYHSSDCQIFHCNRSYLGTINIEKMYWNVIYGPIYIHPSAIRCHKWYIRVAVKVPTSPYRTILNVIWTYLDNEPLHTRKYIYIDDIFVF